MLCCKRGHTQTQSHTRPNSHRQNLVRHGSILPEPGVHAVASALALVTASGVNVSRSAGRLALGHLGKRVLAIRADLVGVFPQTLHGLAASFIRAIGLAVV